MLVVVLMHDPTSFLQVPHLESMSDAMPIPKMLPEVINTPESLGGFTLLVSMHILEMCEACLPVDIVFGEFMTTPPAIVATWIILSRPR